ncbi:MAG: GDSL-type esterase/lipase family protein [Propionibacteriales bacterium]|nr:GDSL-type esterase/lipase family protein [Propionibacteriales bacterium]
MNLRSLLVTSLCAALAAGGLAVSQGSPAAAVDPVPPVKILLGGDSLTQGFDGDYTWRYRLYKELKRQGLAFDFVGPETCPTGRPGGGSCTYLVPGRYWDTDHGAKGGTRLKLQMTELVAQMTAAQPDVLVALYGTTDLLPTSSTDPSPRVPVDEEIEDLRTYIQEARQVNATIKIVLGEVQTSRITVRQEFNDKVNALAAAEDAKDGYPDSRVVVANLHYPTWDQGKLTYDTTHPNPTGEAVIAQQVAKALQTVGTLPSAPAISSSGLVWAVPWAPSIRVSATRRLVVNWSASYLKYAPKLVRVHIRDLRTGKVSRTGWTGTKQYVSAPKLPGRYRIAIQGRRDTMYSPWSKIWTVTVKP